MWQIHLVVVRVVPGQWFIVVVRCFVMVARIRVDVLRKLSVMLMAMVPFLMGMLDHDGSPTVGDCTNKRGKDQQPTREDGVNAVLFPRAHEGVG